MLVGHISLRSQVFANSLCLVLCSCVVSMLQLLEQSLIERKQLAKNIVTNSAEDVLPVGKCSRWARWGRPACQAPPGAPRTPRTRSAGLSGSQPANILMILSDFV